MTRVVDSDTGIAITAIGSIGEDGTAIVMEASDNSFASAVVRDNFLGFRSTSPLVMNAIFLTCSEMSRRGGMKGEHAVVDGNIDWVLRDNYHYVFLDHSVDTWGDILEYQGEDEEKQDIAVYSGGDKLGTATVIYKGGRVKAFIPPLLELACLNHGIQIRAASLHLIKDHEELGIAHSEIRSLTMMADSVRTLAKEEKLV